MVNSHSTSSLLRSNARTPGILAATMVFQVAEWSIKHFVLSMALMPSTCHKLLTLTPVVELSTLLLQSIPSVLLARGFAIGTRLAIPTGC